MIISRGHATNLAKDGKATLDGSTYIDLIRYQIVVRHDFQRVDHFRLWHGQLARVAVHHGSRDQIEARGLEHDAADHDGGDV